MSYTELMVVNGDGDVVGDTEFRNSHGFCSFVWNALIKKYKRAMFPDDPFMAMTHRSYEEETDALWLQAKDKLPLRWWEHNVLQLTYDRAMVKHEDFALMAQSLRRFEDALAEPQVVCHMLGIAARFDELVTESVSVACVHGTSLSENLWSIHDEEDECRPYNINTDTGHWFIEMRRVP